MSGYGYSILTVKVNEVLALHSAVLLPYFWKHWGRSDSSPVIWEVVWRVGLRLILVQRETESSGDEYIQSQLLLRAHGQLENIIY